VFQAPLGTSERVAAKRIAARPPRGNDQQHDPEPAPQQGGEGSKSDVVDGGGGELHGRDYRAGLAVWD
jgi:hypothetical protein